jgi:hypothetical protein
MAVGRTSLHLHGRRFRVGDRDFGQCRRKQSSFVNVRRQHEGGNTFKRDFHTISTQTGFASIKAGLTLNSTLGAVFEGSTTEASSIDVSSTSNTSATVIAGGNFLRADAADTTTGALTVDADGGVIIGDAQEFTISVSSNDVTLAQASEDKDILFSVNTGGTPKTIMTMDGSTGDITINGNLNITGEYNSSTSNISTYDDAFIKVNRQRRSGCGTDR